MKKVGIPANIINPNVKIRVFMFLFISVIDFVFLIFCKCGNAFRAPYQGCISVLTISLQFRCF
jgi:hypothetical protein